MRGRVVVGVLTALLVAAGCTADDAEDPARDTARDTASDTVADDSGTATEAAPAPGSGTATAPPEAPDRAAQTSGPAAGPATEEATGLAPGFDLAHLDGDLREQTQWVLEHLVAGGTGPSAEEVSERFAPEFLEAVPADQVEPVLVPLREGPALTLTAVGPVSEEGDGGRSTELTLSGDQMLRVSIMVDGEGLIGGLLLQPGPPPDLPELGSWEELDEGLAALGGTSAVFVGDVSGGVCTPVHVSQAAQEPAPSGSVFKLIVLSALVEAIEDGELTWEQELTITPEVKSLPSGQLQDRPGGSTVSVREAAELMIAISDNTGTDLLIEAVGQERLAAAVARISDEPGRLTPLLTTQQFFLLGWDAPQVREQWADADVAGRVALLEDLPTDLSRLAGNPFAVSRSAWPDGVDWFLTGEEICQVHAILQQQAETVAGEPVRGFLSANPGLPRPEAATYQGFKGGSAPGVLAYTFYLETATDTTTGTTTDATTGTTTTDATTGTTTGLGTGRVLSVQVHHTGDILATGYTDLTQAGLALLVRD